MFFKVMVGDLIFLLSDSKQWQTFRQIFGGPIVSIKSIDYFCCLQTKDHCTSQHWGMFALAPSRPQVFVNDLKCSSIKGYLALLPL